MNQQHNEESKEQKEFYMRNRNNQKFNDLITKFLDTGDDKYYSAAYSTLLNYTLKLVREGIEESSYLTALPDAEDIAQNFWIDVYEKKVKAFNMVVSVQENISNEIRAANRQKRGGELTRVNLKELNSLDWLAHDEKDPSYWAEVDDQVRQVHEYIETLPKERKMVCKLGILDCVTQTEMQNEYGIAQPFASRVLTQERQKIKELLTNDV